MKCRTAKENSLVAMATGGQEDRHHGAERGGVVPDLVVEDSSLQRAIQLSLALRESPFPCDSNISCGVMLAGLLKLTSSSIGGKCRAVENRCNVFGTFCEEIKVLAQHRALLRKCNPTKGLLALGVVGRLPRR